MTSPKHGAYGWMLMILICSCDAERVSHDNDAGDASLAGTGGVGGAGGIGGALDASSGADASRDAAYDASNTNDAAWMRDAGTDAGHDAARPEDDPEGVVHIVKRMGDPSFDAVVTSPSSSTIQWLNDHFYRMEVFTTFFDDKTSFYPNGWVYWDSAAIYVGSSTASAHPEWILEDSHGDKVFIDWGCSGGTCPQYAADISNPEFRAWWIEGLTDVLERGYRGAWIDDVNLALRFSDGSQATTAISPTSHITMTEDVWSAAVASFMMAIDAALPHYELLHNSIWYARPQRMDDPLVRAQIMAADVINMEGGFASDGGLTGGTGEWSIFAKLAFADAVHALGRWVVVDDFPSDDTQRQYALGCYLLLSTGRDALGDASMAPDSWWHGYDVNLGRASSARSRESSGLFRREFEHGLVLVLEPGAASQTVQLPHAYLTLEGASVTHVTLAERTAAVLLTPP